MSTLQERFALAIAHYEKVTGEKFRKAHLAKFCKVSPPAVSEWIEKNVQTLEQENAENAAKFLGVSHRWLNGLSNTMLEEDGNGILKNNHIVSEWSDGDQLPDGVVAIEFFEDVRVSAGSGYLNQNNNDAPKHLWFRKETLSECNVDSSSAKAIVVQGDSMWPELTDNQVISVDRSAKRIFDGEIYAFLVGNEIKVKYLFKWNEGGEGAFKAISRNEDKIRYPDEYYSTSRIESEGIEIIGQYWWKSETRRVRR